MIPTPLPEPSSDEALPKGDALPELGLDALFQDAALDAASRAQWIALLTPWQQRYAQAIAQGGAREEFMRWQASLQVIEAALEILRGPSAAPPPDIKT